MSEIISNIERLKTTSVRFSADAMNFIAGDKGGVGKSAFVKSLLDALAEAGVPFQLFEADRGIQDAAKHVKAENYYDLNSEIGFRELLEDISKTAKGTVIVVSTPAGLIERAKEHSPAFLDIFPQLPSMLKRPLRVSWVIDEKRDVLEKLKEFRAATGSPIVDVVKNEFFCKGDRFKIFDSSELKKQILDNGGQIMCLPKLNPNVMAAVTNNRWNREAALEQLGLYDRAFYSRWWDEIFSTLQAAGYVP